MAAEAVAHRGKRLIGKARLLPASEARKEGGSQHRSGNGVLHRGIHRPAPLAAVTHAAGIIGKFRLLGEGSGGEVEQP